MKVENETKWNTQHIAAFIRAVAKEEFDPARLKKLKVRIRTARIRKHRRFWAKKDPEKYGGWRLGACSGYAYLNSTWFQVNLPAEWVDRIDLCHVIAHEMAHCRGLRHGKDMNSSRYRRMGNWRERYAWAEEMPLEKVSVAKPVEPKVTGVPADMAKLLHAEDKIMEWEKRLKMAQTKLKTWRKKQKYYQNKMAKAASKSS